MKEAEKFLKSFMSEKSDDVAFKMWTELLSEAKNLPVLCIVGQNREFRGKIAKITSPMMEAGFRKEQEETQKRVEKQEEIARSYKSRIKDGE